MAAAAVEANGTPKARVSSRQRPQTRSHQAWPPQDVRRRPQADFAGAEEALGGQTEGRLSGFGQERSDGAVRMKPDEVAELVLDIEAQRANAHDVASEAGHQPGS